MTVRQIFEELENRYGDEFNWYMLPFSNKSFVEELKKEIGSNHFLYNQEVRAVAKCESNDDVLYVTNNGTQEIYYVVHLTYTEHNTDGFPKYKELLSIKEVKEFIEQSVSTSLGLEKTEVMIDRCDKCSLWSIPKTDICPECGAEMDLVIEEICLSWKCRKCEYSIATTANKLCFFDNKEFSDECYSKRKVCLYWEGTY